MKEIPSLPPSRDPLKAMRVGHVPPRLRSRAAVALAVLAAEGRFGLQCCVACGQATYPPRDVCPLCWGDLDWQDLPRGAEVVAETVIRATTDLYFRDHLPWRIGTVKLDAGPVALAHLHQNVRVGSRVEMRLMIDRGGCAALYAVENSDELKNMPTDANYDQFIASIRGRRILVTDGQARLGHVLGRDLLKRGARQVFLGSADLALRFERDAELTNQEGLEIVPLDVTDTSSVDRLAAAIGGKVDILVNTASYVRPGGVAFLANLREQKRALEVNVLGLSRLAHAFGPSLAARSSDGANAAVAFVDIVPIVALAGSARYAGLAASASARLSLQWSLRAEMSQRGIRVLTIFTGPLDDEWHQDIPPPKLLPSQISKAIIDALEEGREETCVGDVASEFMKRWQKAPKASQREMEL